MIFGRRRFMRGVALASVSGRSSWSQAVKPSSKLSEELIQKNQHARELLERNAARPTLLPSPAALRQSIPRTHPRIFFRDGDFDRLRSSLNKPAFQKTYESIRAAAERTLRRPVRTPTFPPDFYAPDLGSWDSRYPRSKEGVKAQRAIEKDRPESMVIPNALMFRLTGDVRYRDHARLAMKAIASLDLKITGYANTHGFNGTIPTLAVGLDYLWDELERAERDQIVAALVQRTREFHRLANPVDDPFHNHNITYGPPNLTYAALALYHHEVEAENWLWDILVFFDRYWPSFGGDDGGWGNSLGYGEQLSTQSVMHALFVATGINFFETPWARNNGKHLLYFQPPYDHSTSFGDASYDRPKGLHKQILQIYAAVFQDPYYQWYADQVDTPSNSSSNYMLSHSLYWPKTPTAKPPTDQPESIHFRDIDWVAIHSHLADRDRNVMLQFKSSHYGSFNHSHADQNSFILSAFGCQLLIDSGYYPWYGSPHDVSWTRQTRAHNALLINGKGQGVWNIAAAGRIIGFAAGTDFDYTAGDATAAYQAPSLGAAPAELCASREGVLRVVRRIVFCRAEQAFVILDEVETRTPAAIQFLLHALQAFEIEQARRVITISTPGASARIHCLEPGPVAFSQTNQFSVSPEREVMNTVNPESIFPDQWHLTCDFAPTTSTRRLLTVIVVGRRGDTAPTQAVERVEERGMIGAKIGNATVTFDPGRAKVSCRTPAGDGTEKWFEYSAI